MSPPWLANSDPLHDWAGMPWPAFAQITARPGALAILPLFPLTPITDGSSLDAVEQLNGELLRLSSLMLGPDSAHLVLPPLRFLPQTETQSCFCPDFASCHRIAMSLCRDIAASGVRKLVLYCPHLPSRSFAATIAIDARESVGLATYVLTVRPKADNDPIDAYLIDESATLSGLLREIMAHREKAVLPQACTLPQRLPGAPIPPPCVFHNRTLASLTQGDLKSLAHNSGATAILPTAAIEQHGHHLPVGVDAILGQALLASMFRNLPPNSPVWVAPPITYGKSNEHRGWPGTLSIDAPTLHSLVEYMAGELLRLGFKRIRIFNTHGGNTAVLQTLIATLRSRAVDIDFLVSNFTPEFSPQEQAWGMHADEWETSLMLACAPELVQMEKARCEYPAHINDPGQLRPEKSQACFAWLTSDVSSSGVMGDPLQANEAKGQAWLDAEGCALARCLLD